MSLNADIKTPTLSLEELLATGAGEQSTGEDTVLSVAAQDAPTAVINVDTREGVDHATTLNQDEIDLLPQLHNKINIISEQGEKLVEMEDLQSDIENKDAISMVDADEVNATFEGMYTESFTSKRFSKTHSKVGLSDVKKFMTSKIAVTREALVSDFREVITKDVPQVQEQLDALQTQGIEKAVDLISKTCMRLTEIHDKLTANPNLIIPLSDNRFVNLGKEDFTTVQIDQVSKDTPFSAPGFNLAFNELVRIWKTNSGVRILSCLAKGQTPTGSIKAMFSSYEAPAPVGLTLDVIMAMFASKQGVDYNAWLVEIAQGEIRDLNDQITEANNVIDNAQAAQSFITHSASKVNSIVSQLGRVKATVQDIGQFAQAALTVVETLTSA